LLYQYYFKIFIQLNIYIYILIMDNWFHWFLNQIMRNCMLNTIIMARS
jgi:hypothetical protein